MDSVILLSDTSCNSDDNEQTETKEKINDHCKEPEFSISEFPEINFNITKIDDLSHSNDSYDLDGNKKRKSKKTVNDNFKLQDFNSDASNLEFPEINFDADKNEDVILLNNISCDLDDNKQIKSKRKIKDDFKLQDLESDSSNFEFPEINFNEINSKGNSENNLKTDESENDSDYESQNISIYHHTINPRIQYQFNSDLFDNYEDLLIKDKKSIKKDLNKKNGIQTKKTVDEEKKKRQEERQQNKIKKQEEQARQKAMKQLQSKNRLRNNPEYCMQLMEVIFDEELQNSDFLIEFLKVAQEYNIKFKIQSQLISKSITWNRKVEENYLNEKHEVCVNTKLVNEKNVIIILNCQEIVNYISTNTLNFFFCDIKKLMPDNRITLVVYKIEDYFKYLKQNKKNQQQNANYENCKKPKTKVNKKFSDFPKISKKEFDECLTEIQIMYNISSRLIESANDMILLIRQFTKSLALLPSKVERHQGLTEFDWYINCDNRDTVKVDKDGNGLKRLWQQQLCQFALMSLEMAEAISLVYGSPLQLMEAYANCSPTEGEMLLKDIPVRRAAKSMNSARKIGPELSRKVYVMFTSESGNTYLNIE